MSTEPTKPGPQIDPERLRALQAALERALLDAEADASSPALLDDVRELASRHGATALALEPAAVDLVQRMICRRLGVRLGDARGEGTPLRRLAAEVASTMWDHPESRRRLERLWAGATGSRVGS